MVGEVADVHGVREAQSEGEREISAAATCPTRERVAEVADVSTRAHPSHVAQHGLAYREQERFHAVVELAVGLLTVDYVEHIRYSSFHV